MGIRIRIVRFKFPLRVNRGDILDVTSDRGFSGSLEFKELRILSIIKI
jgi:hypothetical protein